MNCPLCETPISDHSLVGPYIVSQPSIKGTKESGHIQVCGRCFLLVSIKDILVEIRDGNH